MQVSNKGIDLIASFEGFRALPYQDDNGVWTNGYGNTHGVSASTPSVTESEARAQLQNNIQSTETELAKLVRVSLNGNEWDALVSFTFNIGCGHLRDSTTLKRLNAGDRQGAADAMLLWDRAGGVIDPGLLRRREAERSLFLEVQ